MGRSRSPWSFRWRPASSSTRRWTGPWRRRRHRHRNSRRKAGQHSGRMHWSRCRRPTSAGAVRVRTRLRLRAERRITTRWLCTWTSRPSAEVRGGPVCRSNRYGASAAMRAAWSWSAGGETSLANLMLLCSKHHTLVHEGGFRIEKDYRDRWFFRRPDGRAVPACGYRAADSRDDDVTTEDDYFAAHPSARPSAEGSRVAEPSAEVYRARRPSAEVFPFTVWHSRRGESTAMPALRHLRSVSLRSRGSCRHRTPRDP